MASTRSPKFAAVLAAACFGLGMLFVMLLMNRKDLAGLGLVMQVGLGVMTLFFMVWLAMTAAGRIEVTKHDDLLRTCETYQQLYERQVFTPPTEGTTAG